MKRITVKIELDSKEIEISECISCPKVMKTVDKSTGQRKTQEICSLTNEDVTSARGKGFPESCPVRKVYHMYDII